MKKSKQATATTNPFLKLHTCNVIEIKQKVRTANLDDFQGGVVSKYEETVKTYVIEQDKKVSLYKISGVQNIIFKNLSNKGRNLFFYIAYNVKEDSDFINLKLDTVAEFLGISRPTIIIAINELIDIAFLLPKAQSEYWINPTYLFEGNRIGYYNQNAPEQVIVKSIIKKQ